MDQPGAQLASTDDDHRQHAQRHRHEHQGEHGVDDTELLLVGARSDEPDEWGEGADAEQRQADDHQVDRVHVLERTPVEARQLARLVPCRHADHDRRHRSRGDDRPHPAELRSQHPPGEQEEQHTDGRVDDQEAERRDVHPVPERAHRVAGAVVAAAQAGGHGEVRPEHEGRGDATPRPEGVGVEVLDDHGTDHAPSPSTAGGRRPRILPVGPVPGAALTPHPAALLLAGAPARG